MATPLWSLFSTAENQVSQCDDQTCGSTAETPVIHPGQEKFEQLLSGGSESPPPMRKHNEVGVARAPLANSSKQVPVETGKALCKPTPVFWRNKEGQDLEPITFENLVVHFDKGKFDELLSGGGRISTHGSIGRSW